MTRYRIRDNRYFLARYLAEEYLSEEQAQRKASDLNVHDEHPRYSVEAVDGSDEFVEWLSADGNKLRAEMIKEPGRLGMFSVTFTDGARTVTQHGLSIMDVLRTYPPATDELVAAMYEELSGMRQRAERRDRTNL